MKHYLGDGAYVAFEQDRGALRLTAENGIKVQAEIFLEPDTYLALVRFVDQYWPELAQAVDRHRSLKLSTPESVARDAQAAARVLRLVRGDE